MANENLGASFSIDVTALKAGLAQANRLIKESESEFKAAAAGMDDWSKSEAGLTAKIKSLNQITELQSKKVNALQSEYDRLIADGLDPTSKEAVELRTKINNETAALEKNKSQTAELEETLSKFKDEAKKTGKTVDEVAQNLDDMDDKAEKAADGFTIAKGAIATFIGNGLTALVGACKNAISSIIGLAESTQEYREDMGKLETAFEAAGKSTEIATDTYKNFYSVLGEEDRSVEAVNHLAKFVDTEQDMSKWTNICAGVWGTFGDSLPIEGLTEASNETAKVGQITGVLADALNWAGVSEDDFQASLDKCNGEQERAQLITDTLNGLYSEAADHYKENNASVIEARKANSEYTDSMAALGEKIEPITTKVREGFNKILEKMLEIIDGVDLEALGEKIDKAFEKFINDILPKIIDGLTWIINNKDIIIAGIAGIGAAFLAFKVVGIIQGVTSALQGMTVAQAALNLVMSMNPIGLIIAAVAGLVAAFVVLWNKCDAFREFWVNLWDNIKKAFGAVVDWIKENWKTMLLFLVNPLAGIFKYCYEHFEGFRNFVDNIVQKVKGFFTGMWDGFKNGAKNAWEAVKNTFSKVASFFKDTFTKAWTAVKNVFSTGGKIFDGIKDGITNAFKNIVNAIIRGINKVVSIPFNAINKVLDKIRNVSFLGISPFKKLIGQISVPEIPQLAKGGIVRKATNAIIGEDGAEAVIPLEKNKQWIKKIAKEISAEQGHGVIVNQTNNFSQAHSRYEIWQSEQKAAAAVRLALLGG